MRSRRTLGVDVELAEELKSVARSRGMSLVGYLRKLFEEVIDLEKTGYFAPGALKEKKADLILSKLGFTYIPLELLSNPSPTPKDAEALGERIGNTLRELGISSEEIIERLALSSGIGIARESSIILVPSSGPREIVRHFLIGLARGCNLDVSASGSIAVIRTSRYPYPVLKP